SKRHLPVRQLTILAICRFAEPISLTSIFPYLPEMIESFHVPPSDIAFWAGTTSAVYSLSQCVTAIAWGRASDRFGRKYIILLGLLNTMITSLLWGFSTTLPMALTVRALSGAGNGNVGIIRTMVAEMCPWRELQPRAFSIMPLVYNVGSVLGPAFGGALSNPLGRKPEDDRGSRSSLLWKFPYALPNIVAACFFMVGITVGTLFLKETLASQKNKPDNGLVLGEKIKAALQSGMRRLRVIVRSWRGKRSEEEEPLLEDSTYSYVTTIKEEDNTADRDAQENEKPPKYREVLTRQTMLNLLVYTLLAMHSIAFDQLLPVFMHHPRYGTGIVESKLPFTFNKGFGIDSGSIGALFTIYGIVGIFYQFVIFPPMARHYGVLNCLRVVLIIMPLVYLLAPFSTLVPSVLGAEITLLLLWLVKGLCSTFAFPCSTILLTNSAPSLRVLGTINGIATSVSAIGRAAGPTVGGATFTWGTKNGFIIAPFWTLSLIAAVSTIPAWWLVEGHGFGDDNEIEEEEEEDLLDGDGDGDDEHESSTSKSVPISRENTISGPISRIMSHRNSVTSSVFTATDDEYDDEEEGLNGVGSQRLSGTRAVRKRRSSVPIGMGTGFRRMSSNLGQTRSGFGTGG
ncbi:MFS general substrate transporter, partial [Tothia fuscella]